MKYNIFQNQKDKNEAKTALPELVNHPGWKFILRTLDANIEFLTDELKETPFEYLLDVSLRQKQLTHLEELKNLPQTIVEAAQDDPEQKDDAIYEE